MHVMLYVQCTENLYNINTTFRNITYITLLYKVWCFIKIASIDKTDNLTCEIIYDNFTCENYRFPVKIIAFQRLSFI
jgi:hypothetical protein